MTDPDLPQMKPAEPSYDPRLNPTFDRNNPLEATDQWKLLKTVSIERPLTNDEVRLMVEVTRILRRTNTGPAQGRKKPSSKRPALDINELLD